MEYLKALSLSLLTILLGEVFCLTPIVEINKISNPVDAHRGTTQEIRCVVHNKPKELSVKWVMEPTGNRSTQDVASNRLSPNEQKYGLKYEERDVYTLIIKNIDPTDDGKYTCRVQVSRYVPAQDSVDIRVVETPRINPMLTSSDITILNEGTNVNLSCAAFGIPEPLIKWTRAGNGLMPGGGFVRYGQYLQIPAIEPQDAGPYICSAKNHIGEDFRTVDVKLIHAPIVRAHNSIVSQKTGHPVKIVCDVDVGGAAEETKITWSRAGEQVKSEGRYKIVVFHAAFERIISKLVITSTESADYTHGFTCTAANTRGQRSSASFTLQNSAEVVKYPGLSSSSQLQTTFSITISMLLVTLVL